MLQTIRWNLETEWELRARLQKKHEKNQAPARSEVKDTSVLAQPKDQTTMAMEVDGPTSSLVAKNQLTRLQTSLAKSQRSGSA
ncbi:hypothetical protein R1flu_016121 [Riccia fluitans]|uniref:Uncharacterized protein n=1 Tax=Riccia fluitans TaxID=41844 RepID=A0ABD1YLQ3_9MARC